MGQQLRNQATGDYATLPKAIAFKEQMSATFQANLESHPTLKQSMAKNQESQTQIFDIMQRGKLLTRDQTRPIFENHFNDLPLPAHLHLSYLGTLGHSVDVVFTKNNHGMFATVCNRGLRGNHDIFETYQLNQTGDTSQAASLLESVHFSEITGGNIDVFYACFGEKLTDKQLTECEFKIPPDTKSQKVGNCVRASMSAAQKWMANEHDCMDAHKQVKPILLQALAKDIAKLSQALASMPTGSKVPRESVPLVTSDSLLVQMTESLRQISNIPILPQKPSIRCLLGDLLDTIAFFKEGLSMETPFEESDKLIQIGNNLLLELARLSEDHCKAINEMLGNKPPTLPKPPIKGPSGDASPSDQD